MVLLFAIWMAALLLHQVMIESEPKDISVESFYESHVDSADDPRHSKEERAKLCPCH
jgi:hypothetical protein